MDKILIPISFFAASFGAMYVFITARNRERMAMIERGMFPNSNIKPGSNRHEYLKWGLLLIGLSLGTILGEAATLITGFQFHDGPPLFVGSAFLFGGIALLICYLLNKKVKEEAQ